MKCKAVRNVFIPVFSGIFFLKCLKNGIKLINICRDVHSEGVKPILSYKLTCCSSHKSFCRDENLLAVYLSLFQQILAQKFIKLRRFVHISRKVGKSALSVKIIKYGITVCKYNIGRFVCRHGNVQL